MAITNKAVTTKHVHEKGRTTMKRRRMNEEQLREKSEKKEFYPKTYTISN